MTSKTPTRRTITGIATGIATAAILTTTATTAHAAITDDGTADGATASHGCSLIWKSTAYLSDNADTYPIGLFDNTLDHPAADPLATSVGMWSNVNNTVNNNPGTFEVLRTATKTADGTYNIDFNVVIGANKTITNAKVHLDNIIGLTVPGAVGAPITSGDTAALVSKDATLAQYKPVDARTVGSFPAAGTDNADRTYTINSLPAGQDTSVVIHETNVPAANLDGLLQFNAQLTGSLTPDNCTLALPKVTQTAVDGTNNDRVSVTLLDGAVQISDTGWVKGKRTYVFGAPEGTWFNLGGKYVHAVSVTLTDSGVWKRTTTTSNPSVGIVAVDQYTFSKNRRVAAHQIATVRANLARHQMGYLGDTANASKLSKLYRPGVYANMARSVRREYVPLDMATVAKYKTVTAAVDAETRHVANVGGVFAAGRTVTVDYLLPKGGSAVHPWGTVCPVAAVQTSMSVVRLPKVVTTTKVMVPGVASGVWAVAEVPLG